MVKVYFDATDTAFTLNNTATVYGNTGDEKVIINTGVFGVILDQNINRVDLPGTFSAFTYKQAGNNLEVWSGLTLVTKMPVQGDADGTQIVASNGSVFAKLTAGVMTLGGATVSSAAASAVTPTTVNATVVSGSNVVAPSVFSISSPATSVSEGTSATYTVSLSSPQTTTTTVELAKAFVGATAADVGAMTVTGATLGTDGKTLTFAPGLTSAIVTLPVTFDSTVETGDTVKVSLVNPSTGTTLGTSSVTTTLVDPAQPTFVLSSNAVVGTPTQEGNTINFTVTPSSVVVNPTTLTINVTGETVSGVAVASAADFNPPSTTVTFAAGESAPKTVSITVASDTLSEGLESYQASLLDGSTGALKLINTVSGTINDPVPALTLAADKTAVDEGGSVTYTVTSNIAATSAIIVPYTLSGTATAGADYTGTTTGTITIAANTKVGSVTVNTIADNLSDGNDSLIATLGTPSNGTITTGTVTTQITDTSLSLGAAEIALSGTASVDEGGSIVYTLTRGSAVTGAALEIPYTLSGTATNGTDYTGSTITGKFTMAVGATSATVTLPVTADSLTEAGAAETVVMTLGTLPAGTTAAAGRGVPITTSIIDTSLTVVGDTGTLTLSATDTATNKTIVNGVLDTVAPATNRTWHVSDTISGTAAASDALNALVLGNTANTTVDSYAGLTTTLIENFNFRYIDNNDSATATGATIDATTLNGATKLAVKSSTVNGTTNSDTFTINGAAATATLEVANNSSLLNVTYKNAGALASADSVKVMTTGGATGVVTLNDVINNGFATVNVTTDTAASTLRGLDAGTSFTTLNVSGNQDLTITNALANTVTTLNAGANSGAVNLTTNSSTLTATGGTGTTDMLTLNTIPTGTITGFETVVVGATNSTLNLTGVTGATKLGVATGLTSAAFTNAAATTNTIGLSGNYQPNGAALTTSTSLTTGTLAYTPVSATTVATDTLTIAVNNGGTANTGIYTAGTIAANQIENLTLTTADWTNVTTGNITQTVAATVAGSITVSGAANLTLNTVNITGGLATATDTYNFGGVAGTLSATIGDVDNASVTGAAGADTLITTAMTDTSTTVATTQTFNLGNGDDTITFLTDVALGEYGTAGADKLILNGEAGADTFKYTAAVTATDDLVTIAGGAGNDTLYITASSTNAFGPTATVSGLEGITFGSSSQAATTNLAWTGGSTDVVTINEFNSAAETLNLTTVAGSGVLNTSNWSWQGWIAADQLSLTGDSGNDVLTGTIGLDTIAGGAGADTIDVGSAGVVDVVVVNAVVGTSADSARVIVTGNDNDTGQDTITANFTVGTDLLRIVATNVTSFVHGTDTAVGTATGSVNDGTVGGFLATTGLVELNQTTNNDWDDAGDIAVTFASAPTNKAAFESSLQYNLTGTSGNDTLTTGAQADTITGGAGNDAINVGATDGVSDRVVFSAPASNGSDTITNFNAVTGATGDILYSRDFTFVAGTAADTALNAANTAACDAVTEFVNNVVAVNATDSVTAGTWQTAANAGDIDTTLFSRLLVLDIGATANIYYVENTTVADDNSVSITLLGTFSDIATITGGTTFVAANFDFIA